MRRVLRFLLPTVLLGLLIWVWIYLHPAPDEAIRRHLKRLSQAASFDGRESLIKRGVAAQRVADFFAPQITLNINPPGIFLDEISRAEIAQQVKILRSHPEISSFKLTFLDPVITLGADRRSAIVEVTMNAEADEERHLAVQEVRLTMREIDGDWVICRIETVRTLNQRRHPKDAAGSFPA
jgi:CRP-like cAMP-binding protein